jgi:hypothetical protein
VERIPDIVRIAGLSLFYHRVISLGWSAISSSQCRDKKYLKEREPPSCLGNGDQKDLGMRPASAKRFSVNKLGVGMLAHPQEA